MNGIMFKILKLLKPFQTDSDASSDATMRLTEKLEPYIILQYFVHTSALRVQCEQTFEIY